MEVLIITPQQLRYIVTTVDCGSISETAKHLLMTQSSLSNSVRELEKEMGIPIFSRGSKGIALSSQGMEFLSYVRQVLEQVELLEQYYANKKPMKRIHPISTQHYAFTINTLVNLISCRNTDEYEFTLREIRTYKIINDVKNHRSELGILHINDLSRKVLKKLFEEGGPPFHPLFRASPHVFINITHPLSARNSVTIEDLEDYPFLAFEQGEKDSFYFLEEILNTIPREKAIYVSDRVILFSLLIGLDGHTICSDILNRNLNDDSIMAALLETEENMVIGWIGDPRIHLSEFAGGYLEESHRLISSQPQDRTYPKTPSAGIRVRKPGW